MMWWFYPSAFRKSNGKFDCKKFNECAAEEQNILIRKLLKEKPVCK